MATAAVAAAVQEASQQARWPKAAMLVGQAAAAVAVGLHHQLLLLQGLLSDGRCCQLQQTEAPASPRAPAVHLLKLPSCLPCLPHPAVGAHAVAAACCRRRCLSCDGRHSHAGLGRQVASAAKQEAPALQNRLPEIPPASPWHQPAAKLARRQKAQVGATSHTTAFLQSPANSILSWRICHVSWLGESGMAQACRATAL
jgi:hypothetical protein